MKSMEMVKCCVGLCVSGEEKSMWKNVFIAAENVLTASVMKIYSFSCRRNEQIYSVRMTALTSRLRVVYPSTHLNADLMRKKWGKRARVGGPSSMPLSETHFHPPHPVRTATRALSSKHRRSTVHIHGTAAQYAPQFRQKSN